MGNKFHTDDILKAIAAAGKEVPAQLGAQAQNFFSDTFKKGGFTDNTFVPWQKSQRTVPGTRAFKAAKPNNRQKPTEVMSGALRRAVSISVRKTTFQSILLTVPLQYAFIQNYGGTIHKEERMAKAHFRRKKNGQVVFSKERRAHFGQQFKVGEHDIEMPARPFMKHSATLQKMQIGLLQDTYNKAFKI